MVYPDIFLYMDDGVDIRSRLQKQTNHFVMTQSDRVLEDMVAVVTVRLVERNQSKDFKTYLGVFKSSTNPESSSKVSDGGIP